VLKNLFKEGLKKMICNKKKFIQKIGLYVIFFLIMFVFMFSFVCPAFGFERVLMSDDLALSGQKGWVYYNGGDAPEGAYMGSLAEGINSLNGIIFIGETLQPGQYYISLKVINYAESGNISVSIDDSKASVIPDNRDFNRYWTLPETITVLSPADRLNIKLIKTLEVGTLQKYLLIGVYISSVPNQIVDRYDRIVNLTYPVDQDNSTAKKGNIIENSSFEVGIGHGWGLGAMERDFSIKSAWDNSVSYHGQASLRVAPTREVITKVYRLNPNKKYTFSAWVKTTYPAGLELRIKSTFGGIEGYSPPTDTSKSFSIDTNWRRVSLTEYLPEYPTSDYQFIILVHGATGNFTWIDAVQVEEGDLSEYMPKKPLEVGIHTNHSSNIFFEDEAVTLSGLVYNENDTNASATISYEVYDYFNLRVKKGSYNVNALAKTLTEQKIDLSTGKRGIFRVLLWLVGENGTEEEFVYAVLPRNSSLGLDEKSIIGIHTNFTNFQLSSLKKAGINWVRVLSPAIYFRWKNVEPDPGHIIWYDEEIQRALSNDIAVLGTIGTNNYWPEWADQNGLPDLDAWESFVERLVSHYKDSVKYWEIWNEPIHYFTTQFYAKMLKRASVAIRRADPQAKIIGMGGVYSIDWVLDVIGYLGPDWTSYMDFISTHLYPPSSDPRSGAHGEAAKSFRDKIIDNYDMPVWNTETGVWDLGFYRGSNSNFIEFGGMIYPHANGDRYYKGSVYESERVAYNFLHSIGNGLSGYFYYDGRQMANPSYFVTHMTLLEYDESIRSKGIAYFILAHFFDHSKGLGNISPNTETYAYLFDKDGKPTVGLWAKDQTPKSITLSTTQFKVYDMMGNEIPIPGATIDYSRTPVYVVGQGISVDALRAAFQTGVVSTRKDNLAPNISVDFAPRGPIEGRSLRLRWIAIDDTSIPSKSEPDAILYSYKLDGYSSNWSDWSANTYLEYSNVPNGSYTFFVKAKDEQGNVSTTESREVIITGGEVLSPPPNFRVIE
jgi:hypothetical protein